MRTAQAVRLNTGVLARRRALLLHASYRRRLTHAEGEEFHALTWTLRLLRAIYGEQCAEGLEVADLSFRLPTPGQRAEDDAADAAGALPDPDAPTDDAPEEGEVPPPAAEPAPPREPLDPNSLPPRRWWPR